MGIVVEMGETEPSFTLIRIIEINTLNKRNGTNFLRISIISIFKFFLASSWVEFGYFNCWSSGSMSFSNGILMNLSLENFKAAFCCLSCFFILYYSSYINAARTSSWNIFLVAFFIGNRKYLNNNTAVNKITQIIINTYLYF